jgi:hypothetical protein
MDKKKKKFEVAKQILRWIWLAIQFLFLILFIILQAPLKVLAIIAILLLECTVLPRRYRKWFWAAVGIVILGLIVWIFLPESDEGWKLYTFDDELAALEAKNKIPYEENAAVVYDQLLADYNKSDLEPNFLNNKDIECELSKTCWHSRDYPEAAKWIKSNTQIINKLIEASKFEKCRFNITSKSPLFIDTEMPVAFRHWAKLLLMAANNDIAEGRTAQGLNKIYCTVQIGKHIHQQPLMIEVLVGMAIEDMAISNLKNLIVTGNVNKKQLDVIEEWIKEVEYDWHSDLPRILDYEKLLPKKLLGNFYEVNAKGQYRFIRDPSRAIRNLTPNDFSEIPPQTYFQRKLVKAGSIIYWFFAPATPQEFSKIIDTAYQKFYETTDPNFDWSRKPSDVKFSFLCFKLNYKYLIKILTLMTEPAYYKIHDLYLREGSYKKGALLLIAARRYKDKNRVWPENLAEIADLTNEENFIDPANGQSFVYKLTGDSFTLYGRGKNGIDNGGQRYSDKKDENNDDINIWPLKPCKKELPKVISEEPNETQSK